MIPQQAASTVTNVDDIEAYIRSKDHSGKTYLTAIDLPMRDRKHVIRELGYRSELLLVPTPEREPETVTKPSPTPQGENWASESDWGAEGWKAPEEGLEPPTRRLTAGCSTS